MNLFKRQPKTAPLTAPLKDAPKRDRDATEKALLQAASVLFAEKGFEGTRTLEIAKAAGVNEALITRYFGGKEGLLIAVLKDPEWEEKLMPSDCLANACPASKVKAKVAGLSDALGEFFQMSGSAMKEKEGILRIAMSRALLDESIAESMRKKIVDRRLPELEESLKQFTSKSKITPEELQAMTMLIGSSNFSLNFLGRLVHKMSPKKVSLALTILAESLELYLKSRE